MQCPTDGSALVMSERSGVEIDYCPTCRGVWLDRGELDKILDRASQEFGAAQSQAPTRYPSSPPSPPEYNQRGYQQPGYGNQGYPRKKKRESWLSDLFD